MQTMQRLLLPALLLILLGWLAPAAALDFTDTLGRTVTLPDTIEHVLPAGPAAEVAIYMVAPGKLVGWAKPLSPKQLSFIAEPYRDRPVTGRLTGQEASIGAEEVKKLHPDLIIDIGDLDPGHRALADKIQSETGIPYIVLDGSLANLPELHIQLSKLLDGGLRGDTLTLLTASTLERVDEQRRSALRPPRIYYARDRANNMGMSELDPQILEALGAISIAGRQAITPGQIADRNPDIILTANADIAQQIRKDPAYRDIAAVAQDKIYVVPSFPFGWLGSPPGPNRLIGLEWLSALLYPGQPKQDLGAAIRAFYRNYYQVALTDAQLQQLLASEQGSE